MRPGRSRSFIALRPSPIRVVNPSHTTPYHTTSKILFALELVLYSWAKTTITNTPSQIWGVITVPFTIKGYLFDFYFWLDFLGANTVIAHPYHLSAS